MLRPSLLPGLVDACVAQPAARAARRPAVRDRQPLHRGWRRARGRIRVVRRGGGAALVGADAHRRLLRREGRRRSAVPARRDWRSSSRPSSDRSSYPVEPRSAPIDRRDRMRRDRTSLGRRRPAAAGRCRGARLPRRRRDLRRRDRSRRWSRWRRGRRRSRAESLPRFPSIVRDISILVDEALPAAAVRGTIRSAAPATLVSIVEFDRYQGRACRKASQPVAAPHVPRAGSHADGRRGAGGDRTDRRGAARRAQRGAAIAQRLHELAVARAA